MLPWYLWIVNRFFQNTSLKCEGQSGLNFIVNIVIRTGEPSKWRLGILETETVPGFVMKLLCRTDWTRLMEQCSFGCLPLTLQILGNY